MEIESLKRLLKNTAAEHTHFVEQSQKSLSYYNNKTDITIRNGGESKVNNDGADKDKGPLRRADYRVSSNFHQILVDQKADYLASKAPKIDTGIDATNKVIDQVLGDDFAATLQELCVDASNCGVAWLHVWHDDAANKIRYAPIPPDQVIPLYAGDTDRTLLGVCRKYAQIDPEDGTQYTAIEYWDKTTVTTYRMDHGDYQSLRLLKQFVLSDASTGNETGDPTAVLEHGMGEVPFIPFRNGKFEKPDLQKYKGHIDIYDQVYNGFANDLADVQQVILVLTNYGAQSLDEFMTELKDKKAVKLDSTMPDDKSGLTTLTIDIPTEARQAMLDLTFDDIFVYGQGVNPKQLSAGTNTTAVAIKMLYGQLELKAATTETYFRQGVSRLVRMILRRSGVANADTCEITQTWTRSLISNDLERADIISKVADHTSRKALAQGNPLVEDAEQELKDQDDDTEHEAEQQALHPDPFSNLMGAQQAAHGAVDGSKDDDGDKSSPNRKKGVDDE
ncbi:phage portal protein [Lacticaseibacillus sp. N501-2]|uniref:phage portal protein n=1 Tax=Lacticaseibacillus salsurae TaxID=3367729 RepID=UPI0038B2B622